MANYSDKGYWVSAANKNRVRKYFVKQFKRKKPAITLLLPGSDIMCLRMLHKKRLIRPGMKFILVERLPNVMAEIQKQVKELCPTLFDQCQFFEGELHHLVLEQKVNFSFIDLVGNLTRPLFDWFLTMYLPHCSTKAATLITIQRPYRGNNFMRAWRNYIWNENRKLRRNFRHHKLDLTPDEIGRDLANPTPFTLWMFTGLFYETGRRHEYEVIHAYKDVKADCSSGMSMVFLHISLHKDPAPKMCWSLADVPLDEIETMLAKRDAAKAIAKSLEPEPASPPIPSKQEIMIQIKRLTQKIAGQKAALTKLSIHGTKGHRAVYEAAIAVLQEEQNKLRQLLT
jgi:hypothetical protein